MGVPRRNGDQQAFPPVPRSSGVGLGFIVGAVVLTGVVGFFVKRSQADPRRNTDLPIPRLSNRRFSVKLIGTGVESPPVSPTIPAAAWAEFEVLIDGKPSVSGQTAFQTRAVDEAGNRVLCHGIWVNRRYFVILVPGLKKWKGDIRVSIGRSDSEICLAKIETPKPPKDWFAPTLREPRDGVSVDILRMEKFPEQLALKVMTPQRPHELYILAWGGSSTTPSQFTGQYLVVPPSDWKGPWQSEHGNLIPVFQNYVENAKTVRIELIRLRSTPKSRTLEFPVPFRSLTGDGPGFGTNIIRDPNNPFVLLSPVGRFRSANTPAYLTIQRTLDGYPSRLASEFSEMTLLSPAKVGGHPIKINNFEVRLRMGSGVVEGKATGSVDGLQPDELVPIRVSQRNWEFREVDRQEIILPFDSSKAKQIRNWNPAPLLVRFEPPNHLELLSTMGDLMMMGGPGQNPNLK